MSRSPESSPEDSEPSDRIRLLSPDADDSGALRPPSASFTHSTIGRATPLSSETSATVAACVSPRSVEAREKRDRELAAMSGDRITWRHVSRVVLSGTGFLADAFDLFVINPVMANMAVLYPQSSGDKALISSMALWGAVAGQIIFGLLADTLGRRVIFMTTILLISIGSLGSALSFDTELVSIYAQVAFWRFILGFGVGGEYPLSATITQEAGKSTNMSTFKHAGTMTALVFSMQGVGSILSASVVTLCLEFGASHEFTWRFALGLGALPGIVTFPFRARMEETEDFKEQKRQAKQDDLSSIVSVPWYMRMLFAMRAFMVPMIGTAGTWFLLDVTFYGNGLFSSTIARITGLGDTPKADATNALIVASIGLPGYFLGVYFLEKVGRRRLQLVGFAAICILYLVMGLTFESIKTIPALFMTLYGLTFLFSNCGPNMTTYVIPSELFPTVVKATCHGISAAAGKTGAGIAGDVFPALLDDIGVSNILIVCAGVAAIGFVWTMLFIPTYSTQSVRKFQQKRMDQYEDFIQKWREKKTEQGGLVRLAGDAL